MKFTALESDGSSLISRLIGDDGRDVGQIFSTYTHTRHTPFTSNHRPGYLTIRATAWPAGGTQEDVEVVAEFAGIGEVDGTRCAKRRDADRFVRRWLSENDVRAKVIDAAQRLNASDTPDVHDGSRP